MPRNHDVRVAADKRGRGNDYQVNREEFDELKTRVDQRDEALSSLHLLTSTAIDVMKQGITVMENGFNDVGKQIADMGGDIGDMRGDISSMQKEMTTMREDIGDMRADIRDLKDAITKNGRGPNLGNDANPSE